MRRFLLLTLPACALLLFSGCGDPQASQRTISGPRPTEVAPGDAWVAFENNEASAEAVYRGKLAQTHGIVRSVEKAKGGKYVLTLCDPEGEHLCLRVCTISDSPELQNLRSDSSVVTVQGVVRRFDRRAETLYMEDCKIVKVQALNSGPGPQPMFGDGGTPPH